MLECESDLDQKESGEYSKLQSNSCHSPKVHTGHMEPVEGMVDALGAKV